MCAPCPVPRPVPDTQWRRLVGSSAGRGGARESQGGTGGSHGEWGRGRVALRYVREGVGGDVQEVRPRGGASEGRCLKGQVVKRVVALVAAGRSLHRVTARRSVAANLHPVKTHENVPQTSSE